MILQKRAFPFVVKEIADTGMFTGYASVFDVLDYYRDVVRRGAFARTLADWKQKGRMPPLLWQHDSRSPLGPHEDMFEDEKGLYVKGRLLVEDVPQARTAHALLKAKVISGMSIGFDLFEDGMQYDGKTNVWNLTAIQLWENSLATFPANDECHVEDVKSIERISELEDVLRDAAGLSRAKAKQVASLCFARLVRDVRGKALCDAEIDEAAGVDLSPLLKYLERAS